MELARSHDGGEVSLIAKIGQLNSGHGISNSKGSCKYPVYN